MGIVLINFDNDMSNVHVSEQLYGENFSTHGSINPEQVSAKFAKIDEIVKNLSRGTCLNSSTGIFPPGVLAITKNFIIFERPPEYKNIFIIPKVRDEINSDTDEVYNYRIPIPWQLYIIQYNSYTDNDGKTVNRAIDVRMHFMHSKLVDLNQKVYMAPLPNLYTNGNLCRPMYATMEDIERYSGSISSVIEEAYDWIWNSGTNLDLTESIAQYYIQLQGSRENNLFSKTSFQIRRVNKSAYYVTFDVVNEFLLMWEKFTLEEVIELNWPINSESIVSRYTQFERNELLRYLDAIDESVIYDELHYDEEADNYYQCDDDPSCYCHNISNAIDRVAFQEWLMTEDPTRGTALRSISLYIKENSSNLQINAYNYSNLVQSILLTT